MAMNKNLVVVVAGVVLAVGSGIAGSYASLVAGVGMVVAGVGAVELIKARV